LFTGLSRNAATLLGTKVAYCLLAYCEQKQHSYESSNSVDSKQAMAILKAGKLESMTNSERKLVSALTRGGLWSITQLVQQIFFKAECYFRDPQTWHQKVIFKG